MSELSFSCPSCGQHIQCEKAYGGHVIHCPNCCAELRIPFANSPIPTELSMHKAELILDSPAATNAAAHAGENADLHCICPVCQSELRLPARAISKSPAGPPTAEVVRHSPAAPKSQPKDPPPAPKPEAQPKPEPKPAGDRDQQIAAARETNQVSLYPAMKPRLSYILKDARPGPEESPAPQDPQPDPQSESKPPDDTKTVAE